MRLRLQVLRMRLRLRLQVLWMQPLRLLQRRLRPFQCGIILYPHKHRIKTIIIVISYISFSYSYLYQSWQINQTAQKPNFQTQPRNLGYNNMSENSLVRCVSSSSFLQMFI
jgi:hypothetical protein